jgi:hypothetical protein
LSIAIVTDFQFECGILNADTAWVEGGGKWIKIYKGLLTLLNERNVIPGIENCYLGLLLEGQMVKHTCMYMETISITPVANNIHLMGYHPNMSNIVSWI